MMNRLHVSAVVAALVLAGLAACGGVPQRFYYTLSYPVQQDRASASRPPLHPFQLRLKPFKSSLPYDRPQIVYRESPYEYQYYTFKLWASKPQQMIRELVETNIDASRLVAEVTREYGDRAPDYELAGDITAIEEFDSGDLWYGHLAIRFQLVRYKDKATLWHYSFDRKRKVYKKQPVYVVRSLSAILEDEMARVVAELDAVLSAERGVPPTLRMPAPSADDESPRLERDETAVPPAHGGPATAAPERPDSPRIPNDLIVPDEPAATPAPPQGGR